MLLPARGKTGYPVEEYGGRTGLTKTLRALLPIRGFPQVMWLGIMRDADDNPRLAFESVRDSLQGTGLPRPAKSWFTTSGAPAVTAFILPDSSSEGDLEELVWRCLTASNDKAVPTVKPGAQYLPGYLHWLGILCKCPNGREAPRLLDTRLRAGAQA